jgi:hypothetical protein
MRDIIIGIILIVVASVLLIEGFIAISDHYATPGIGQDLRMNDDQMARALVIEAKYRANRSLKKGDLP